MIILKEQRAYEFQHFVIMQAVCPVQAELRPGLCLTFLLHKKTLKVRANFFWGGGEAKQLTKKINSFTHLINIYNLSDGMMRNELNSSNNVFIIKCVSVAWVKDSRLAQPHLKWFSEISLVEALFTVPEALRGYVCSLCLYSALVSFSANLKQLKPFE